MSSLFATLAIIGATVVGHALTRLDWAGSYRERTGEGLGFVQVGLEVALGAGLLLAGVIGAVWAVRRDR